MIDVGSWIQTTRHMFWSAAQAIPGGPEVVVLTLVGTPMGTPAALTYRTPTLPSPHATTYTSLAAS